jgi:phage replication initiation protein
MHKEVCVVKSDSKQLVPPATNRGVQNTYSNVLRSLVDWVSVTYPHEGGAPIKIEELPLYTAHKVIESLGYEIYEFKEMKNGINGYKRQLRRGHISILYDGHDSDMGVHVIMSGQGCREFENEYGKGWSEYFRTVFEKDGHFTRLDLAIDDFEGYFTVDQIAWRLDRALCSSRFKSYRYLKKGNISDGAPRGMTVYFGSAQSDIQIRIYDKQKEREEAGKEVTVDQWVRTEVQLSDERANMAAGQVVWESASNNNSNVGVIVCGVLKNYIKFFAKKEPDTNKSRWKTWKPWDDFVGDVAKLKLTNVAPDKTIGRSKAWIDKQTAKTLGKLFVAYDSDIEWLVDVLNRGMESLEEKEFNEIETYKRNERLLEKYIQENKIEPILREKLKKGWDENEKANIEEKLAIAQQHTFKSFEDYMIYCLNLEDRKKEIERQLDQGES